MLLKQDMQQHYGMQQKPHHQSMDILYDNHGQSRKSNHHQPQPPSQGVHHNSHFGMGSGQSEIGSDAMAYFNETLDLSHEDIQKTLSANMPTANGGAVSAGGVVPGISPELNPMDFMDNVAMCEVSHASVHDEDLFVNLDAFDMFVEFSEFESQQQQQKNSLVTLSSTNTPITTGVTDALLVSSNNTNPNHSVDDYQLVGAVTNCSPKNQLISDFSPEWAYPEGGVKVLVTGPWTTTSSYVVLFDSFPVPTTLVQNGVLRCYCPAHDVGLVSLQVAREGNIISDSVVFEYKAMPKTETAIAEGSTSDGLYKFNLLNRLEALDERMQIKSEADELVSFAITVYFHDSDLTVFCFISISSQRIPFCSTSRTLRIDW